MLGGDAEYPRAGLCGSRQPVPKHERTTGGAAFYRLYETRDGRHLVLGRPGAEIRRQPARRARPAGPGRAVRARARPASAAGHRLPARRLRVASRWREWQGYLATLDVCFAPVNTLPEALDDPNVLARGMILRDETGRQHIVPADPLRDEPARPGLQEPASASIPAC